MLASFESRGMISVWQMESMSLAQDAAGDFYSSSAEKKKIQSSLFQPSSPPHEANGAVGRRRRVQGASPIFAGAGKI